MFVEHLIKWVEIVLFVIFYGISMLINPTLGFNLVGAAVSLYVTVSSTLHMLLPRIMVGQMVNPTTDQPVLSAMVHVAPRISLSSAGESFRTTCLLALRPVARMKLIAAGSVLTIHTCWEQRSTGQQLTISTSSED